MNSKIFSPEKNKFVTIKSKHGQDILRKYEEHRKGGNKKHKCAFSHIVNPKTGNKVSIYGQTGGGVLRDYRGMSGGMFRRRSHESFENRKKN